MTDIDPANFFEYQCLEFGQEPAMNSMSLPPVVRVWKMTSLYGKTERPGPCGGGHRVTGVPIARCTVQPYIYPYYHTDTIPVRTYQKPIIF